MNRRQLVSRFSLVVVLALPAVALGLPPNLAARSAKITTARITLAVAQKLHGQMVAKLRELRKTVKAPSKEVAARLDRAENILLHKSPPALSQISSQIQQLEKKQAVPGPAWDADLGNALKRGEEILKQLSDISKVLHDTALAVIRKIG